MTTTAEHCGDSCGLIDFTMAVAGDRLLPEELMKLAIEAVTSGKMSQRGAAKKYGVAQRTLSDQLKRVSESAHPTKTQATTEKQADLSGSSASGLSPSNEDRTRRKNALRRLARANGLSKINGKSVADFGPVFVYEALSKAGVDVPDDIKPRSLLPKETKPSTPSTSQNNGTKQQRLHSNDSLSVNTDRTRETDQEPEHPAFADELDIDAVREHVNREVQQSNRPADFKRAIELLTELDIICTNAWYRRQPEPWGHDDWAHVSSEIEALHSIVGQRAEETADELLRKSSAIEVTAAAVS